MEVGNVPTTTTKSEHVNFSQISRSYLVAISEMQMPIFFLIDISFVCEQNIHSRHTEYQKSVFAIKN